MAKWFGVHYNQEVYLSSAVKCKKGPQVLTSLLNHRRNYYYCYITPVLLKVTKKNILRHNITYHWYSTPLYQRIWLRHEDIFRRMSRDHSQQSELPSAGQYRLWLDEECLFWKGVSHTGMSGHGHAVHRTPSWYCWKFKNPHLVIREWMNELIK